MADGLTWAELFAEPPEPRSPHWFSATYARLLAVAGDRPRGEPPRDLGSRARRLTFGEGSGPLPDPLAVGSRRPSLVLVGESPPRGQPAFRSRSGHWLLRALREAGWDEAEVLVTNACEPPAPPPKGRTGKRRTEVLRALADALEPVGPTWVALGRRAAEVLRAAGVPCVEAVHPQWAARFATAEGARGLAERFLAAGLPAGPWRGKALPVAPHPDARTALADRFALPRDVAFRKAPAPDEVDGLRSGTYVGAPKREEARRLYVLGEVPTVKAAAEAVGCSVADLQAVAREERWAEQRDRHLHEAADRAIREAGRAEAKAVAAARRLAWAAAQLALKGVADRLASLSLVPEAKDAAALVAAAARLAELDGPALAPAERPVADLVREARKMLAEYDREHPGEEGEA